MTRVVVVTGTDTDVGKTIVTAALAAVSPPDTLVVKPVQTGMIDPAEPGDATTVERLTGRGAQTFVVLDDPLAPDTAARRQGVSLPAVAAHAQRVRELAASHDRVVVEGAGGLLVRLDAEGGTLLDLVCELTDHGVAVEVVVVCRADLGTLNHTALTVSALRGRGIEPHGLVIGSWPAAPGLAETTNRADLSRTSGVPLLGVVPAGAGTLPREEFLDSAPTWWAGG
ncbi:dethiobiotin synthase [Nocardioides panacisoli]|uniref:dethiobiotin synthase n=1 Tax=Nocardioides panacisoli TaxID=627624 RepID=UPI001C63382F|nr:dethiobiotin synthase [Nocardioides panacisoli]QYJ04498.1 dethiobiotin synthase [Nocardioides panacisoli]